MALTPKNTVQMNKMRAACRLAAEVLDYITPHVKAGVSTLDLNNLCNEFILRNNAISATLGYHGYPSHSCISRNEIVCHGIPSADERLQEGDILNIDITVIKNGFFGDTSRMYEVGPVDPKAHTLVTTTHAAMLAGIATVKSGSYLNEIGNAIEAVCAPKGYGIVQDYCGHGIGDKFHTAPQILHYANTAFRNQRLKKGLTFTVEPMVNLGSWRTELMNDGWTVKTADRSLSAQWEHTIAVTEDGTEILTLSPEYGLHPPFSQ